MTAASEFTPAAELTEDGSAEGRSRFWLYAGIGTGIFVLIVIGVVLVPALLAPGDEAEQAEPGPALAPPEPLPQPAATAGQAASLPPPAEAPAPLQPSAEQPVPDPANADKEQLLAYVLSLDTELPAEVAARFEDAFGMSYPEFAALPDDEQWNAVWGAPAETALPDSGPAIDDEALRQQMLDNSNAAGPGELPMTDEAADRAMVAVGLVTGPAGQAEAPRPATRGLTLVNGVVNTGGGALNVRQNPGIGSPVVGQVANGIALDLSAWATAGDGGIWVRIQDPAGGQIDQGWVFALLVDMEADHTTLPRVTFN